MLSPITAITAAPIIARRAPVLASRFSSMAVRHYTTPSEAPGQHASPHLAKPPHGTGPSAAEQHGGPYLTGIPHAKADPRAEAKVETDTSRHKAIAFLLLGIVGAGYYTWSNDVKNAKKDAIKELKGDKGV